MLIPGRQSVQTPEVVTDHRVLVAAPTGHDAGVLTRVLSEAGVQAIAFTSAADLCREMEQTASAVILAEEFLSDRVWRDVSGVLAQQPEWSDLPVIVMAAAGEVHHPGWQRLAEVSGVGNVVLLQRPVRRITLLSSIRAALRSRERQYQVRDELTRRRLAEQARRESEERYRQLIELLPVAVYRCAAPSGIITFYNEQAARLWGRAPKTGDTDERFCGSFRLWLGDGQHLPHHEAPMAVALREGRAFRNEEVMIERPDGSRINVLVNIDPIRDPDGKVIAAINSFHDITDRKRAEEALEKRARQQRAVARLGELALREREPQTVLDYATATVAETLEVEYCKVLERLTDGKGLLVRAGVGWNPGLVGHAIVSDDADSLAGYTLASDAPIVMQDLRTEQRFEGPTLLYDHGVVSGMNCIIRSPGGAPWGVLAAHCRRETEFTADDVNFLTAVANILSDAIERDRAEAALRASEERFRELANNIDQFAWTCDELGVATWYNRRWFEYTGTTCEEMQGPGWTKVMHPDHLERIYAGIRRSLETGEIWEDTFPIRSRDGEYRWFLSRALPIRGKDGHIVRWLGTNTDVTEQRLAEEALRESEAKLRAFAESNLVGMLYCTLSGEVTYANDEYLRMLGFSRAELERGQARWDTVTPPEWQEADRRAIAEARMSGAARPYEKEYVRPDGTRVPVIIGFILYGPQREQAIAFAIDQSERKQLERERDLLLESERAARTAAEHSSRAKDEFLSVVNHELRSPLATILGWSRILDREHPSAEDRREAVGAIVRASEQLQQLIDDLLDIGRISAGKLKLDLTALDVALLARETVADFLPVAQEKGVRLEESIATSASIRGDAGRLRQLLANLLSNAIKFTPHGGRVAVRVAARGDIICITVEDTGIGIPAEVLPHLFQRFRQADASIARKYQGLGLGLALVKYLAEMHGGHVRAASPGSGRGATFTVELPRVADLPGTRDAEAGAGENDLNGLRVLLVDDDPEALKLGTRLLEEARASVTCCRSADQALAALRAAHFDLLLTDISMPGEDGYALLRQIRAIPDERRSSIAAIAVTAFARLVDRQRTIEAGFDAHHAKPIDPQKLYSQIHDLVEKH